MIKSKYLLTQEVCCGVPGNFIIHERTEDEKQLEQESGFSELNFAPQDNVGKFQETGVSVFCCFSCKSIKELSLQMYGQRLSQATTQTTCCFNICGGDLVVSEMKRVIIGRVKKTCSSWCSPNILVVQNDVGKDIFFVRMRCCQSANILPRIFRFNQQLTYEIVDDEGILVGTIVNTIKSCSSSLFSLRDEFSIHFMGIQKQREKVLLLNAVVLLNQVRHEWL